MHMIISITEQFSPTNTNQHRPNLVYHCNHSPNHSQQVEMSLDMIAYQYFQASTFDSCCSAKTCHQTLVKIIAVAYTTPPKCTLCESNNGALCSNL